MPMPNPTGIVHLMVEVEGREEIERREVRLQAITEARERLEKRQRDADPCRDHRAGRPTHGRPSRRSRAGAARRTT